ncbi:DUF481 domain-containing protein [Acinetobacter sp. WZC-1]|uniref:DUF481 domain-containing protein n=1 Tax=Acinetobacter sp. WZC-1 TaxID=3459034 RepID=UPI00403E01F6
MNRIHLSLSFTLMGLSAFTHADLGPKRADVGIMKIDRNYKLESDLSYLVNSSKTDDSSTRKENLAANLLFQRQHGAWGQEVRAEAVSSSDSSDNSNGVERYMLLGKLLQRESDTTYRFIKLQGDKDLSSVFDYQLSLTGGVGFDLVQNKKQKLTAEFGTGYRLSKQEDPTLKDQHELIGNIAGFYEYQFNPLVKFNQDISYEFGGNSQTFRSRSTIAASLSRFISALISYQIKNIRADAGNSQDKLLSVGLRYRY